MRILCYCDNLLELLLINLIGLILLLSSSSNGLMHRQWALYNSETQHAVRHHRGMTCHCFDLINQIYLCDSSISYHCFFVNVLYFKIYESKRITLKLLLSDKLKSNFEILALVTCSCTCCCC